MRNWQFSTCWYSLVLPESSSIWLFFRKWKPVALKMINFIIIGAKITRYRDQNKKFQLETTPKFLVYSESSNNSKVIPTVKKKNYMVWEILCFSSTGSEVKASFITNVRFERVANRNRWLLGGAQGQGLWCLWQKNTLTTTTSTAYTKKTKKWGFGHHLSSWRESWGWSCKDFCCSPGGPSLIR